MCGDGTDVPPSTEIDLTRPVIDHGQEGLQQFNLNLGFHRLIVDGIVHSRSWNQYFYVRLVSTSCHV